MILTVTIVQPKNHGFHVSRDTDLSLVTDQDPRSYFGPAVSYALNNVSPALDLSGDFAVLFDYHDD
jgi:hypothetical protein